MLFFMDGEHHDVMIEMYLLPLEILIYIEFNWCFLFLQINMRSLVASANQMSSLATA